MMGGPGSGGKPREYPAEIVAAVRRMYTEDGMPVLEVQAALPAGFKAQRIIERHIPTRRPSAKREQRGSANSSWKGDSAGYDGFHARVIAARGKPSLCERCGTTEGTFDSARRAATGCRTMPRGEWSA